MVIANLGQSKKMPEPFFIPAISETHLYIVAYKSRNLFSLSLYLSVRVGWVGVGWVGVGWAGVGWAGLDS